MPIREQPAIMEELVQTDIDLAEKTGQSWYQREAIDYLDKIIANGWAGYTDYDTLTVLHQKQGNLKKVEDTLKVTRYLRVMIITFRSDMLLWK